MNRRDFIKQSAVAAAGIAAGAKILSVADSVLPVVVEPELRAMPLAQYARILGVDLAKPGSDQTIIYLGYSDQLKTHIWKQGSVEMDFMDLYVKNMALALGTDWKIYRDQDCLDKVTNHPFLSILNEDSGQSPWGQMIQDGIEEALTQEEGGFMEALG